MHTRIQTTIGMTALAALATLVVASPCRSQQSPPPPPDNIIVLLADDLGWDELPFFSPPFNQAGYDEDFPEDTKVNKGERAHVRPAVNRFAARMYASQRTMRVGELGTFTRKLRSGAQLSYTVVPIDDDSAIPHYSEGGVDGKCASTTKYDVCDWCDQNDPGDACWDNCCYSSTDILVM